MNITYFLFFRELRDCNKKCVMCFVLNFFSYGVKTRKYQHYVHPNLFLLFRCGRRWRGQILHERCQETVPVDEFSRGYNKIPIKSSCHLYQTTILTTTCQKILLNSLIDSSNFSCKFWTRFSDGNKNFLLKIQNESFFCSRAAKFFLLRQKTMCKSSFGTAVRKTHREIIFDAISEPSHKISWFSKNQVEIDEKIIRSSTTRHENLPSCLLSHLNSEISAKVTPPTK